MPIGHCSNDINVYVSYLKCASLQRKIDQFVNLGSCYCCHTVRLLLLDWFISGRLQQYQYIKSMFNTVIFCQEFWSLQFSEYFWKNQYSFYSFSEVSNHSDLLKNKPWQPKVLGQTDLGKEGSPNQTGQRLLYCLPFLPHLLMHYCMDRVKQIWNLSPMRAAKVQASLRIRAVSPEPPLLAHTGNESRGTFRQKARSLAPSEWLGMCS